MTRSITREVMSTLASSESNTGLPNASCPLAATTFTCDVPPAPVISRWKVQFTLSKGRRLIGASKQPLPPSSSRSPNLSSTMFWIATVTTDTFLIVTEKVTTPPGSLTEVGVALFWTSIAPRPRSGTSAFLNTQVTFSPADSSISLGWEPSEQVAEVRLQPAGTLSETEYAPGSSSPVTFSPVESSISPRSEPSEHVAEVRSQPAGTFSETE